jgi:3-hydroxybutyryl-CoA dehydrogenase
LEIKQVGVLGLGTMGAGIAQICGQAGFNTVALEVNQELVDNGMKTLHKFLKIGLRLKQINLEQHDAALANIRGTTDIKELKDCDIAIEAVVEDLGIKHELFGRLDSICKPETIFASNTSSLSITEISVATKRQDRMFGLHFFNPVPMMKLVEIASTMLTDAEIVDDLYVFCEQIGKIPIKTMDSPGFVVNRLLVPFLNDAAKAFEAGLASAEDIDKAMVHGLGHPMGPLRLLDTIGLDVAVMVSEIMFDAFKDPKYAAPPVLANMVKGGLLGKKSGRGFYTYSKGKKDK